MVETEKSLLDSQEQKTRMDRIIEVCDLNKQQNEEWIRGLSFYRDNLKKCINSEKVEIKEVGNTFLTKIF